MFSPGDGKQFAVTDFATDLTDSSNYSISDMEFGPAHAARRIIVPFAGRSVDNPRSLQSASIGGVSATVHIFRANDNANSQNGHAGIISALVPTGTTGTVNVVFNFPGLTELVIGVIRAVNLASGSAFDTAPSSGGDGQFSMSLDVPTRGIVVAAACGVGGSIDPTWTGATTFHSEDLGAEVMSLGAQGLLPNEVNRTVSIQEGGSPSRYCCASFG